MGKIKEAIEVQRLQSQAQRALEQNAVAKAAAWRRQLYGEPAKPVPTSTALDDYFQLMQPGL